MTATACHWVSFPLPRISSVAHEEHRPARSPSPPSSALESTSSCVHAGVGRLVDCDAVDERRHDTRITDVTRLAIEEVAIEHDEVSRLADLDRAKDRLEVVDPRTPRGVAGERVAKVDPLVGQERRAHIAQLRVDPRDRDLHPEE